MNSSPSLVNVMISGNAAGDAGVHQVHQDASAEVGLNSYDLNTK